MVWELWKDNCLGKASLVHSVWSITPPQPLPIWGGTWQLLEFFGDSDAHVVEGEGVDVGHGFEGFADGGSGSVPGGGFDPDQDGGGAGLDGLEPGGVFE